MGRRLRDFGVTAVVMTVLFGMLMLINPQMRERVSLITQGASRDRWSATGGPISAAAMDALAITSGFAGDNPLMFAFFVVAAVLFMLMVKMS